MIISKTNQIIGITPAVTTGGSSDDPKNLTDPDHSTNYTSSDPQFLTVNLGQQNGVNYVAISGHNVTDSALKGGRITVQDGSASFKAAEIATLVRNNVVILTFPTRNFTNAMEIVFESYGGHSNGGVTVSYIAIGQAFTVPNGGEVGGYNRNALTRNLRSKVTGNKIAAPAAVTKQRKPLTGRLTLPHMLKEFVRVEWQEFLDFTLEQPFFILEDETDFTSGYLCFEPTYQAPTAHNATRELDNAGIRFKVFNGL